MDGWTGIVSISGFCFLLCKKGPKNQHELGRNTVSSPNRPGIQRFFEI
jgi:hypothetical protein